MSHVELPRPLEAYFAHAELDGTDDLRRFTITLPYFDGARFDGTRLDRLQWWWSVTQARQRIAGMEGLDPWRREAERRFCRHIEHWLANNRLRLTGGEPIPVLRPCEAVSGVEEAAAAPLQSLPQRARG